MRLRWQSEVSIDRTDVSDYVQNILIDVIGWSEDCTAEFVVGRIAVVKVLWLDAIVEGESLFDVCDADSRGLHEMQVLLTGGKNEFREDLKIEETVDHVMFVHHAVFHPELAPSRTGVLNAVFNLFGEDNLACIWLGTGDVTTRELAELGMCRVVGSELAFRHSARMNPFYEKYPRGMEIELDARVEMQDWVEREWKDSKGETNE